MKRIVIALLVLCALAVPSATQAHQTSATKKPFPVTVVDDHNNKVRIVKQPKRIVTLFPGQTEMVFALGLENRLVADGSKYAEGANGIVDAQGHARSFKYPSEWPSKLGRDYPVKAPQLTHVEGGYQGTPFDLETIEAAHPDLVIAPYYKSEDAAGTYKKMGELGLKFILLDPANLRGILKDITLVGRATGAVAQARALTQSLTKQMSGIHATVTHARIRPRVFYEIDATNPTAPWTDGRGTFIADAISVVHGANVGSTLLHCSATDCYNTVPLESIARADPQIIVLGDSNYGVKPADVKARPGWQTVSAVKTGKIYPFNDDLISRAGPRIMIGVRALAKLVHPELYRG